MQHPSAGPNIQQRREKWTPLWILRHSFHDIIKRQTYFLLSWDRTELGESSKVDFRLASSDFLPKSQESFRKLASPVNHWLIIILWWQIHELNFTKFTKFILKRPFKAHWFRLQSTDILCKTFYLWGRNKTELICKHLLECFKLFKPFPSGIWLSTF